MRRRNIVIAPCGNKATIFRDFWMKYNDDREFDVCLLFYHEQIKNPDLYNGVEYFYHLKGFKYHMLYKLFTEVHPEWLTTYDYFYFLDDDIEIDTHHINQMFSLSKGLESYISCAALSLDSYCSWPIFKQKRNSFCRFVGQIEVMAPLFNREALEKCLISFTGNRSSWGIDAVWSKLLDYPRDRFVIFDTVLMRHTQPVGQGELYRKLGSDPQVEWEEVTRQYGAKKQNYQEYGRLMPVNGRRNQLYHLINKGVELVNKGRQVWGDYDLMSRVKNKIGSK